MTPSPSFTHPGRGQEPKKQCVNWFLQPFVDSCWEKQGQPSGGSTHTVHLPATRICRDLKTELCRMYASFV